MGWQCLRMRTAHEAHAPPSSLIGNPMAISVVVSLTRDCARIEVHVHHNASLNRKLLGYFVLREAVLMVC